LGRSFKNNESPFGKDFGPAKGRFFLARWGCCWLLGKVQSLKFAIQDWMYG